jgi:hypothetical protein
MNDTVREWIGKAQADYGTASREEASQAFEKCARMREKLLSLFDV